MVDIYKIQAIREKIKSNPEHAADLADDLSCYLEELALEIREFDLSEEYVKEVLYSFSKALLSSEQDFGIMAGAIC
jgi:hypothetical protein